MKKRCLSFLVVFVIGVETFVSCKKELSNEETTSNTQSTATNKPPIALAGPDQVVTLLTDTVFLDGSRSTDPDNNISGYQWSKVAGPSSFVISNASSPKTQVSNFVEGIYLFELTVTDSGGLSAKDTVQVRVMGVIQPCTNCNLVFVSDRDGNPEIYSCNDDGSNIHRLTNDAGTDDQPAWSPDGSQVAFVSNRSGSFEVYTMNADGSNLVRKTFSESNSQNPTWSPDGTRIAYSTLSNGSANIWQVGTSNGSPSLLFEAPGWDDQPAWSPDGNTIALASDWNAYDFVYDVFTISAEGTNFTCLTGYSIFDHLDYLHPSWSPAGTKLAVGRTQMQIAVMNPDGSGLTVVRSGANPWMRTSWSPDGTRIAYTSSGSRPDVLWVSPDGAASGTIVTNGWNADWKR
jgi:Tol biopolymer transport system component